MAREATLTCACCGGEAKGKQWWNRDKGYGLCPKCHAWMKSRGVSDEEMHSDYGVEGLHFHAAAAGTT